MTNGRELCVTRLFSLSWHRTWSEVVLGRRFPFLLFRRRWLTRLFARILQINDTSFWTDWINKLWIASCPLWKNIIFSTNKIRPVDSGWEMFRRFPLKETRYNPNCFSNPRLSWPSISLDRSAWSSFFSHWSRRDFRDTSLSDPSRCHRYQPEERERASVSMTRKLCIRFVLMAKARLFPHLSFQSLVHCHWFQLS